MAQPLKRLLGFIRLFVLRDSSVCFGLVKRVSESVLFPLSLSLPWSLDESHNCSFQTPCLCPLPSGLRSIWSSLRRSCGWESPKGHLPLIDGESSVSLDAMRREQFEAVFPASSLHILHPHPASSFFFSTSFINIAASVLGISPIGSDPNCSIGICQWLDAPCCLEHLPSSSLQSCVWQRRG